ncbi:MAG: hypothetical protein P4M11_08520 [Candidatus Pacebacteria bacterium]|nr:hypothetical protein [Candidatus Paceibacterota bacterium]
MEKQSEYLRCGDWRQDADCKNWPYRHLLDSNPEHKIRYEQSQRMGMQRDRAQLRRELDRTLELLSLGKERVKSLSDELNEPVCDEQPRRQRSTEDYGNYAIRQRYAEYARSPYSKNEAKKRLSASFNNEETSEVQDEAEMPREARVFPMLDIPFHKTRRHFRNVLRMNHTNIWDCDPAPRLRAAGVPNQVPAFDIISGISRSRDLDRSADVVQLPEFFRPKYEAPGKCERLVDSTRCRVRARNQRSNVF